MSNTSIYLDYAATTPIDPAVVEAMLPFMQSPLLQGNSASTHYYGRRAHEAIEQARTQVADLIHAAAHEIIFTSGATEANHLAIRGGAHFYQKQGRHVLCSNIEHSSVLAAVHHLTQENFVMGSIAVAPSGVINVADACAAVRHDTTLVSLMYVNNETGIIQPVALMKTALNVEYPHIKLHCDAVAAAGKIAVDVEQLGVDYLSLASHKLYGPKGVGALYIRSQPRARVTPLFAGDRHELGLRAGTLPTALIVGFGAACALAKRKLQDDAVLLTTLRDQLWYGIRDLGGIQVNAGERVLRAPHILNIAVAGVHGEALLQALPDLAVSSGAACHAASLSASHVLTAMRVPLHLAQASLRMSLGRMTTGAEIDYAIRRLREEIMRLRAISPIMSDDAYTSIKK